MLNGGGQLNLISSVWLRHYYLIPPYTHTVLAPLTFFLLMTLLHPAQPESFLVFLPTYSASMCWGLTCP